MVVYAVHKVGGFDNEYPSSSLQITAKPSWLSTLCMQGHLSLISSNELLVAACGCRPLDRTRMRRSLQYSTEELQYSTEE